MGVTTFFTTNIKMSDFYCQANLKNYFIVSRRTENLNKKAFGPSILVLVITRHHHTNEYFPPPTWQKRCQSEKNPFRNLDACMFARVCSDV